MHEDDSEVSSKKDQRVALTIAKLVEVVKEKDLLEQASYMYPHTCHHSVNTELLLAPYQQC